MKNPWSAEFMQRLIDGAPEGIVICEAYGDEQPVVYVNRYFEQLTGYAASELLGADLRRLQGSDRDQTGRALLRTAVQQGQGGRALLRNYRKDGTPFWNEVLIEPLRSADGAITHYVGYHRDAEAALSRAVPAPEAIVAAGSSAAAAIVAAGAADTATSAAAGSPRWLREDRLTGLNSRSSFEELLGQQWVLAQREGLALTLMMFEVDSLDAYRDTFGRTAVDACLRKVGRLLAASFRRGTDILARWEEGTFCVLSQSADLAATMAYAQTLAQRVFELQIHHPRSSRQRFVTVSSGVAQFIPATHTLPEVLVRAATQATRRARNEQAGNVIVAQESDFL